MTLSEQREQDPDEMVEDLRRQNLQYLYRAHVEVCPECRSHGTLCDVGWVLSRQLISS